MPRALEICQFWQKKQWHAQPEKKKVPEPRVPLKERLTETRNAFWALLLPVIIIGGLKTGCFTPTEAAVIAAADTRLRQLREQVADWLIGVVQIQLHFLAELLEQLLAAAEDDAAGLLVVEQCQHATADQ